jgi:hypothetical protein
MGNPKRNFAVFSCIFFGRLPGPFIILEMGGWERLACPSPFKIDLGLGAICLEILVNYRRPTLPRPGLALAGPPGGSPGLPGPPSPGMLGSLVGSKTAPP